MKLQRPALRYHGGKWRIAHWIVSHFPAHEIYIEPFGGAASVLLQKPRSSAEIYNDLDEEIVEFFEILRDPVLAAELCRRVELTPFSRDEFDGAYSPTNDPIECARRLLIRSFMGFGSDGPNDAAKTGFRGKSNKSRRTPGHDWRNFPKHIVSFTERLRGVVIENRPAIEVMARHDDETALIYADPPYVHSVRSPSRKSNRKNYRHEMSDDDHIELAQSLHAVRGAVILSGYKSDLYDELYADWRRIDRPALADGAALRLESLWLNKAADCAPTLSIF